MAKRIIIDVDYDDGTSESLPVRPLSLIAAERHFPGDTPRIEATLWAAWYGKASPKPTFEEWAATLAAMEENSSDAPLEPTAGVPSSTSSTSPPEAE